MVFNFVWTSNFIPDQNYIIGISMISFDKVYEIICPKLCPDQSVHPYILFELIFVQW